MHGKSKHGQVPHGQAWVSRWPTRREILSSSPASGLTASDGEDDRNGVTMEQVNKLIQEGMSKVHKDLLVTVKEGSDKYAAQVNEEIANVKQEFNNLHVSVRNNSDQMNDISAKLQKTQEDASAASALQHDMHNMLKQLLGNQAAVAMSSTSAAGPNTPGGGARSSELAKLEEPNPKVAKTAVAKTEGGASPSSEYE